MTYRTPANVRDEFCAHPRRVLIITTVVYESRAVKAHLTNPELLVGGKGELYEYGLFLDPAGDWLVVHALTFQGNTDAALVATDAHREYGKFNALMFVGIAGSLKEDIPIGSVVIGDYVYNGHSAKVEDKETLGRPHGLVPALELLTASHGLIYLDEWRSLIRAPTNVGPPNTAEYPCHSPPLAVIKGILSGEEVVAGGKSSRYRWLRSHFNDCGAVEMEGWGVMNAARRENTPAIIVRGISDMCAGKNHAKDQLHQPIAAAHAAAFAFSILSFRSKVPETEPSVVVVGEAAKLAAAVAAEPPPPEERRLEFVFNFEGSKDDWSNKKVDSVVERLKQAIGDENLTLVRIEAGSVRLVMSVRESDVASIDLAKLRRAAADSGVTLLGAAPLESAREAKKAKETLATASVDLLAWEKTLPNGGWMERPERDNIEARFQLETSSTVLLGDPGSGKSALLSKIASDLLDQRATVFALKADLLPTDVQSESDLQHELQLSAPPSELVLRLATLQPVFVFIDQLDALASQLDLRSGRLNVLLNLVRRIGGVPNVHILLSARTFEFYHDVRLRAIEAEAVTLALPPWHDVKKRLAEVGINPEAWPEHARDVVRIPQALKIFLALVTAGRSEPFTTYQAMLEQLWRDRIASAGDSESLVAAASDLAAQMAEDEALWLAASRFDNRLDALKRLEALGFILRSENNFSIAFSHQTVFDYVLARTFVRSVGLLSTYVLDRQDSLFIRAKVWSALNYLREAEVTSYQREFLEVWGTTDLRRHLRFLLIEFIGQIRQPLEFEKVCMAEVLNAPELHMLGLKAIAANSEWFAFGSTAIRDAMSGDDAELGQALQALSLNWNTDSELVIRLIKERWLPYPDRDSYTWIATQHCTLWTNEIEEIATTILKRSPISVMQADHTAKIVAAKRPHLAMRLVRAKLDFLLNEAKSNPKPPPFPADGTEERKMLWHLHHRPTKVFEDLLETMDWDDLPSLAEAAPTAFLQYLWPWYVDVFAEVLACKESEGAKHIYPGRYTLEIELDPSKRQSMPLEKPVMGALQIAIEGLAEKAPEEFSKWADESSDLEVLPVQQLIARGYEVAVDQLASRAFDWILADQRRFQLGTGAGHRQTTIALVRASSPRWSQEKISRFEKAVLSYRPSTPDYLKEPKQRKLFADELRATKKDLLQAIGVQRLAPENRQLVATEQRTLGDTFDNSMSCEVEGGFIGSPMESPAMAKAKDRDILKIFREIPDNTDWHHPTHWMRGGNIQLSRAFAEFSRSNPDRAVRLMEQFEPLQQERASGYALDSMADDAPNDDRIIEALLDLHARGFEADEFKESAARAVGKIAQRRGQISDKVTGILVSWLAHSPVPPDAEAEGRNIEIASGATNEDPGESSILWGRGGISFLPGGNFNILSALASILLTGKATDRDRYFAILDDHLSREHDPKVWKAILYQLRNAGGSKPQLVSTFIRKLLARFPEILATREAIIFLAYAQRWDDQLVFDIINDWRESANAFLQRAYGELVGLVSIAKETGDWIRSRAKIIDSGTDDLKIGLAHAAVNLWPDEKLRQRATETLVSLLNESSKELVAAVMDVFRVTDDLTPDPSTVKLLRALADAGIDMSAAPSNWVIDRLQTLLPHEAELIATIAEKLVAAWRGEIGDTRTRTSLAAPQLTDLALTLHRLGGASRKSGVAIFEAMIEMDAYGARETLAEIDGRFGPHPAAAAGLRLARRRRPRSRFR